MSLYKAINEKNIEKVSKLIKNGVGLNLPYLYGHSLMTIICWDNIPKIAKKLIESGANPDCVDNFGYTPLCQAVIGRNLKWVKIHLKYRADPNRENGSIFSPLYTAVRNGDLDIMVRLLRSGADATQTNDEGGTLIEAAKKNNHLQIVDLLERWPTVCSLRFLCLIVIKHRRGNIYIPEWYPSAVLDLDLLPEGELLNNNRGTKRARE